MAAWKTSEHIEIKIKMQIPSQEPLASSKAPIRHTAISDLFDNDVKNKSL